VENKISNSLLKTKKCIYRDMKLNTKFNDDTMPAPVQLNMTGMWPFSNTI